MIKFKAYRWLTVHLRGARSFTRTTADGTTYVLVSGGDRRHLVEYVQQSGFVEEWAL